MKLLLGTACCLFLFSWIAPAQTYPFKNWQSQDGLPGNNVVYTLNQDNSGFLWTGTTEGLSRFDGFDFHSVPYPGNEAGGYPAVSLKDGSGNLWFGFSDGSVCKADNGNLRKVHPSDSSSVSAMVRGPDGYIYVILQRNTVLRIDPGKPDNITTFNTGLDGMYSAAFTGKGELLIGTMGKVGLFRISEDAITLLSSVENFDYSRVMAINPVSGSGKFVIGTDGSGIFLLSLTGENGTVSRFESHPELETITVKSFFEDSGKALWVSTREDGAVRIILKQGEGTIDELRFFNSLSGLAGSNEEKKRYDNINSLFQDTEGNIWFGHNGKGLSLLRSEAFGFYTPGDAGNTNNIIFIQKLQDDYFLGTPTGFYNYDLENGRVKSFTPLSSVIGRNEISAYRIAGDGTLWIGTRGSGLFVRKNDGKAKLFYRSGDSSADYINDIESDDENIWLASLNGVSIVASATGVLKKSFNISSGLPHNNINKLCFVSKETAYIAAESPSFDKLDINGSVVSSEAKMTGSLRNKVLSVATGSNGSVWAATEGNGLFGLQGDSIRSVSAADGLMNNYIYSILSDSEGLIWMGHDRGFSTYNPEARIARSFGPDFAGGGKCNPDGIYETADGKVLIGTTEGLIVYDRQKDRKTRNVPVNNILSITIGDSIYPYQSSIRLPYKKRYLVSVKYAGINLTDPDKVFYSTYMENHDDDWSEYNSEREVQYSLSAGKYSFNLVSVNDEGLGQEQALSFEITVNPPVWKSWWFLLAAFAVFTGIIILIIRQRDKAAEAREKELQRQVDERTEDVKRQKAEIERQNTEITDSINYAKRIQTSILPDISRLKEAFSDAFILYHPRDIVSGDFYWFDRSEDGKIVIVCADSTGHGVPGAFMSMIGSTLLQDIVKRQKITTPSKILGRLDRQIFAMLNQNSGAEISNDGMDMVICEYNPLTRHLKFASAMRPVILIMDGESFYIKGNRLSVGGESAGDKFFVDQEYFLREGDVIYLFTDGISDQFGGPDGADGKKMKMNRLKRFVDELASLPASEQKVELSKFFYDWKGEHDQVDDVLFMGLRV